MHNLNELLKSLNPAEKMDFMYEVFGQVKESVDQILLFGPSNTPAAEKTSNSYCYIKKQKFFSFKWTVEDLAPLSAVIAADFQNKNKSFNIIEKKFENSYIKYEHYLKMAFLYGTGTCELFAITGAFYLSKLFDIDVSIETIFSNESHTYIRLHTEPEYILDFWSGMVCEYDDNVTWAEVHGERYQRTKEAHYKTDLKLDSAQLFEMGKLMLSPKNIHTRSWILAQVAKSVEVFKASEKNSIFKEPQYRFEFL